MSENTNRLKKTIEFLVGLEVLDIIASIGDEISGIIVSVGSVIFLLACLLMIKQNNKYGGIFCIILGVVELLLGVVYSYNFIVNYDTIDLEYKYLLAIIPIAQFIIGTIITFEAVKYNKELNEGN